MLEKINAYIFLTTSNMAKNYIGYARCSTDEQNLDLQTTALKEYGCTKIFSGVGSGSKNNLPEFLNMKNYLRPNDVIVVWRLDRLSRSLLDAHEREDPTGGNDNFQEASRKMDEFNNEAGIAIAKDIVKNNPKNPAGNVNYEKLINQCVTAARNAKKIEMGDENNPDPSKIPSSESNKGKKQLIYFKEKIPGKKPE